MSIPSAAMVLTSPRYHQIWLHLPRDAAVDAALSSAVARLAAARFGGDPGAVSCIQLGRLVGFTSRKIM